MFTTAWLKYRDDFDQDALDETVCGVLGFNKKEIKSITESLEKHIREHQEGKAAG